ncbi:hypothetical protein BIW53_10565 [Pseudoalteromonas byunsanensis]|uniref:Uncharacterized protein n=2 Tax=Pseudoalteromonas byunsanensis TaxID=327939 RepID=A0A1S1N253_9GAMM|nr:hypothetical protein BIW53_10565 [Pseudoalteromonas byunsanensis]
MFGLTDFYSDLITYFAIFITSVLVIRGMFALVKWGKKMPKGAFILLAFIPLITIFPIPPTVFKNVEKAKQEQRKRKEDNGDGPENDDHNPSL